MRILITGAAGKVGRVLMSELLGPDPSTPEHELVALDKVALAYPPPTRSLVADIEELGQVMSAMWACDAVVHLAAIPKPGITTDQVTFRTNVMGAFNVHEAAFRLGVKRVVSLSSAAILGWEFGEHVFPPQYLPIDEDHPTRPHDAYALSKAAGELIARGYTDKCGMTTVVLRPHWVANPEELDRLAAEGGRTPTRFGTYTYIDVRDLARALCRALEADLSGHHVLYVNADDTTASEPLRDAVTRLLPEAALLADGLTGTRPGISNDRARAILGWRPERSWRDFLPDKSTRARE